jgi:hypothetical protein
MVAGWDMADAWLEKVQLPFIYLRLWGESRTK